MHELLTAEMKFTPDLEYYNQDAWAVAGHYGNGDSVIQFRPEWMDNAYISGIEENNQDGVYAIDPGAYGMAHLIIHELWHETGVGLSHATDSVQNREFYAEQAVQSIQQYWNE
jgi:hypothetical protein